MNHAFLIQEGVWNTEGKYIDAGGKAFASKGRLRVVHGRGVWALQSALAVDYPDRPLEYLNRYEMIPLGPGASSTSWTSDNSALGRLKGLLSFVDDSIISEFRSEDGRSRGTEFMVGEPGGIYRNRGYILRDGEMLSSWSLTVRPWGV